MLGLVLLRRAPRLGRWLAWIAIVSLLTLSFPIVSNRLLLLATDAPVWNPESARGAQAIVILGAGIRRHAAEYGGDTASWYTLEQVRYGAWLARLTHLPVLVTGGAVYGGTPEGIVMAHVLEREFGVPVRWLEKESRDTHENAVFSARILQAAGMRKVLLVAHGVHMARARYEFTRQGIEPISAPTVVAQPNIDIPEDLIPGATALQGSYLALRELLGNVASRLELRAK
jgi:uncharacterized SAM-binding protein YcdF (DUF218 family)